MDGCNVARNTGAVFRGTATARLILLTPSASSLHINSVKCKHSVYVNW